ncbi:MAG TPA: dTMP kinase [Jatrophihabitans sp.]|nr:dTMP kinase [Jatrophihabitans sp.]
MFVALEGIDGSGKTSTADNVARILAAADLPVLRVNKKAPSFTDPLVEQHMIGLRRLLWPADHGSTEDPFRRIGELHWIYLMAAWFYTVQARVIEPAIADGQFVIVDSWIYKFLARVRTHREVPWQHAQGVFDHIRHPDLVVLLDVAPETALLRKAGAYTPGEAGNSAVAPAGHQAFLDHQQALLATLYEFADVHGWIRVDTNSSDLDTASSQVARVVLGAMQPGLTSSGSAGA